MDAITTYLRDLCAIHASGSAVKETSYYPALATLLNAVGATLRPRVRCVLTLRNRGAGMPDGGLFTADQVGHDASADAFPAPLPSRGVIEVKGANADLEQVAASEQVQRYLAGYGQVLLTNYRDFLLVGRDAHGQPLPQERYQLAADESAFWQLLAEPAAATRLHGERLTEYLKRALFAAAPLTNPVDVAWFLASYARDARARIEGVQLPALDQVREALEVALGIRFAHERGDHFFRSTLIQTLFYGVFSAWVLWHHENPQRQEPFDWRLAQHYLHVPVLQVLFHRIAAPFHLRPLNLEEVLNWTGAALNRVERATFFARFESDQAVQYFYEPFLQAFDPELRKELGVWYTPPEVVRYMVARVDQSLREDLGVADGLADPQVFVLDPCTGTGAYLTVERLGLLRDASLLFYHSLALLHAPAYRVANADALRQDWPRIPLPATSALLLASAELGRQVAALLDSEHPVVGITSGTIRDELRPIAVVSMVGGGQINPAAGDLDLTVGWGYRGRSGVTMPAKGRVVERAASGGEICSALGLEAGGATLDIYLNERVYWRNMPPAIWAYTMGGYQVIKKWLSYRERALLGRGLSVDEAREVQAIARRIAALLLLGPQLDANYRAVG
ncbi:hypothetical protein CJ255_02235 [Candidatus Viridilinea mediisalina]|uniref:DNA methyltransferase n=1 Tax=Candidatus Viridilinea mediisalina TaxID=2024553 RepID=A0A2A6RNQ6_9CHLR|nr:hypothetical protein CJ255_02235 [Candidatus Viridilinea mediisalina]